MSIARLQYTRYKYDQKDFFNMYITSMLTVLCVAYFGEQIRERK